MGNTLESLGFPLFRGHGQFDDILARTHRFRSTDQAGLFSLAKDLARLTVSAGIKHLQDCRFCRRPPGRGRGRYSTRDSILCLAEHRVLSPDAKSVISGAVPACRYKI